MTQIDFEFDDAGYADTQVNAGQSISISDEGIEFSLSVSSGQMTYEDGSGPFLPDGDTALIKSSGGDGATATLEIVSGATAMMGSVGNEIAVNVTGASFFNPLTITFLHPTDPSQNVVVENITSPQVISSVGTFSAIEFSSAGYFEVNDISFEANCFLEGTLIDTPDGAARVEDLRIGQMILTADGRAVPVVWLGCQTMHSEVLHPDMVNPVKVPAGALGDGIPRRDLYVSADHALAFDGVLVNAGALVGLGGIERLASMPGPFRYYHIETPAHEVLLAEGAGCESYVPLGDIRRFETPRPVRDVPHMSLPRISAPRLVPAALRALLTGAEAA